MSAPLPWHEHFYEQLMHELSHCSVCGCGQDEYRPMCRCECHGDFEEDELE